MDFTRTRAGGRAAWRPGLRRTAMVLTALLLVAGLATLLVRHSAAGSAVPPPPPANPDARYILVGADADGAVVEDVTGHRLLGVTRAGSVAWTAPDSPGGLALGSCLAKCPDFVMSSSGSTISRVEVPDPPTVWRSGTRTVEETAGIPGHGPGKTLVFAATSPDRAVLAQADERGAVRLELRDRPNRSLDVPVAGLGAMVATDRAVSRAVAVIPAGGAKTTVLWFARGAAGWRLADQQAVKNARAACMSPDGSSVVLSTLGAMMLVPFGSSSGPILPGATHATSCAFDKSGPVVLASSVGLGGTTNVVAQYTRNGAMRWSAKFAGDAVMISASETGEEIAVAGSGHLTLYGPGGRRQLTDDGVAGAAVAGRDLVELSGSGQVTWRALP